MSTNITIVYAVSSRDPFYAFPPIVDYIERGVGSQIGDDPNNCNPALQAHVE